MRHQCLAKVSFLLTVHIHHIFALCMVLTVGLCPCPPLIAHSLVQTEQVVTLVLAQDLASG
jgi:hypothetical protein